ncbi:MULTISPECIES: hypothetical protein [unclassified Sphingomonas]|uniref:hypothetical protein n=1 Tax=unclassified Sphingomonas TaxID=196159 RepID=UPI001AC27EE5|nr:MULTISPECIES: hypothetical protein [unclassified Sphingomonas]MBN8848196.1 hypothetical protein [Sphingomonas sp.]
MSVRNDPAIRGQDGRAVAHILRRTTISLGPLHIVREEHRYDGAAMRMRLTRGRRLAGWYPAGLAALLCVGAGGIALAATGGPLRGDYVVSVPVPDREPIAPRLRKEIANHRPAHRTAAQRPAAAPPAESASDAVDAMSVQGRAAAIDVALRTGEMQEWRARNGDEGGFVVAGPSERVGARACRNLSILIRAPGAPDRVDQRRECRPDSAARAISRQVESPAGSEIAANKGK